jgi:hypothetical protein
MRHATIILLILSACAKDAKTEIAHGAPADLAKLSSLYAALADPNALYEILLATAKPSASGGCPAIETHGTHTTIGGGCGDSKDGRTVGSIEVVGADLDHPDRIDFHGWGVEKDTNCGLGVTTHSLWQGTVTTAKNDDGSYRFHAEVVLDQLSRTGDSCVLVSVPLATVFDGTLAPSGASGQGSLLLDLGRVDVIAQDVQSDASVCPTEPALRDRDDQRCRAHRRHQLRRRHEVRPKDRLRAVDPRR